MTPLTFQPFTTALFPCILLAQDGTLYKNDAAENAGLPFSDNDAMSLLLRSCARQMATSGTSLASRPILTDALQNCNLTIMQTDDGFLAVASNTKKALTNLFSSQMREPITNIFATLPLLNAGQEEQYIRYTEDIQANCYQLLRLASNLEDAGVVQSKNYFMQSVNLSSLVDSICTGAASVCKDKKTNISCQVPKEAVVVRADARLMGAALLNIIRNSLAYTRDSNSICIGLSKKGKSAVLIVEDKGLGVLEENMDRIFEPYFSADPYGDSNIRPGVGLGLSVVREAVTAFGGTVSAESRFGEGFKIYISIPLDFGTADAMLSDSAEYILNRYSPIFVQLCGHCFLPVI